MLAVCGVVLLGLVAGILAWVNLDKAVTLTVDGEVRRVSTFASTVRGVLKDEGITVGPHDVLAPELSAKVGDGAEIVLRRGRLLQLTVDGKTRKVWVTAPTVAEALEQLGMRKDGLYLSASRSERLPLDGFALTVRTPKTVVVVADGRRKRMTTTVATVGEVLTAAKTKIDKDDRVSQLATAAVVNGMTITVVRVLRRTVTTRAVLEFTEIEKKDPNLPEGTREVTKEGANGVQEVSYLVTYLDGKLASRKVVGVKVITKPVDAQVTVGTKKPPAAQPAECADFPTTGGLNWCGLAECESGLNPQAVNPAGPYYGLYQFDLPTWQSNGGTGLPTDASVEQQTAIAFNLFQARGRSPWPVCGANL